MKWFVVIVIGLGGLIAWYFFWFKARKKSQPTVVKLEINGKMYIYKPQVNLEGKFMSLHKNSLGNTLCFSELKDLKKSLKKSFTQHPLLIKKEMKTGRLILIKD